MIWWFTPLLSGGSHHEIAQRVFDVYQRLLVSSIMGSVAIFFMFHIPECFRILFNLGMSVLLTVPIIVTFLSTVIACIMIQFSNGYLLLIFSVALVVPSVTVFRKQELVSDPIVLIIYIRVIIGLII